MAKKVLKGSGLLERLEVTAPYKGKIACAYKGKIFPADHWRHVRGLRELSAEVLGDHDESSAYPAILCG
jgi:hypothetical protein